MGILIDKDSRQDLRDQCPTFRLRSGDDGHRQPTRTPKVGGTVRLPLCFDFTHKRHCQSLSPEAGLVPAV